MDGYVAEMLAAEGDAVEAGAELARLRPVKNPEAALATIVAPFSGTVAEIFVEAGETAPAGSAVIALADFSTWQVETTDLTELDVVGLQVGDPAKVSVDTLPGETLSGTVVDISRTAVEVRGDITYPVTIELDDPGDLPLRWGMTVFVAVMAEDSD